DADAAYKVVAGWKYNVAVSGPDSEGVIRWLQATRLYLDVKAFEEEIRRLRDDEADIADDLLRRYRVDVTKSPVTPRGGGRSARQWAMKHLRKRDVPAVKLLVEKYDKLAGPISQVREVCRQLEKIG